jgi:hypothetical protein
MARLGVIGSTNFKGTSGVYSLDDVVSRQNAKNFLTNYSYDGVFNPLTTAGNVEGMAFSSDGYYAYFMTRLGTRTGTAIYVYQFSSPFDLSTLNYTNYSFSVGDYDLQANCISTFGGSDSILYFSGYNSDCIFSLTNTGHTSISLSSSNLDKSYLGNQDATPRSPFIGDNGTKLFIMGSTNDTVYQYTLSTPYSLSSASYANKSFSVTTQDATPQGIFLKSDGKKMYMIGSTNDYIHAYTLTTDWDISSASYDYDPKSYLVTAQATTSRNDVFFGNSGLNMYVLAGGTTTTDTIFQYSLSTAWNVTSASYATPKSLSVNAQDTVTEGMFFNGDGSKMYSIGSTSDSIFSYTLGVAWDVTSATVDYSAKSFLLSAQTSNLTNIYFRYDGLKMYVLSGAAAATDTVFQYSIPALTAWDVSTATYDNKSFSVNPQDATTQAIFFSRGIPGDGTDGKKMYTLGSTNDTINSYTLATDWDVSTASSDYAPKSFLVSSQTTSVSDVFIGSNGTKMYVLSGAAAATDTVFQYTLSTAWDVSTASYDSKSFSVNLQEATSRGMFMRSDGTRMYIIGTTADRVFQYTLSTAWDVSTASYLNVSFSVAAQEITPTSIFFSSDGLNMYVSGQTGDDVNQYSLSVAWDLSTAAYVRVSASIVEGTQEGLFFSSDGSKMFIGGTTNQTIREYTLPTPWNLTTITFVRAIPIAFVDTAITGVFFKDDGNQLYISGDTTDTIYQIPLGISWSPGNMVGRYYVGDRETLGTALYISPNGSDLYIGGQTGDTVLQYSLSSPWDISTSSYVRTSSTITEATQTGIYFSNDGLKLFVIGTTGQAIRDYSLSIAWNVSTITFVKATTVAYLDTLPQGIFFEEDGSKFYIAGDTNDRVYEISLSQNWNPASSVGRFWVGDYENVPRAMYISPDGLNLYVCGTLTDAVVQYSLAVAWDVSTAAYIRTSTTVGETGLTGLYFKGDGSKMYVIGTSGQTVREFSVATPWNLSSITLITATLSYALIDISPQGIFFKDDGSNIYTIGNTNGRVYGISLYENWNTNTRVGRFFVGDRETEPRSMYIAANGTDLFMAGQTGDTVIQYAMSVPWTIASAAHVRTSPNIGEGTQSGLTFSDDGVNMFITGVSGDTIRSFTLSPAWNVTSPTLNTAFSISFETTPSGLFYYKDPTVGNDYSHSIYLTGTSNDSVFRVNYSATPPNSLVGYAPISNQEPNIKGMVVQSDNTYYVSGGNGVKKLKPTSVITLGELNTSMSLLQSYTFTGAGGISFNWNGTKLYIATLDTAADGGRQVRQVDLSVPYDLTTATLNSTEIIALSGLTGAITTGAQAVYMVPDNSKMFVLSSVTKGLYQFTLKF